MCRIRFDFRGGEEEEEINPRPWLRDWLNTIVPICTKWTISDNFSSIIVPVKIKKKKIITDNTIGFRTILQSMVILYKHIDAKLYLRMRPRYAGRIVRLSIISPELDNCFLFFSISLVLIAYNIKLDNYRRNALFRNKLKTPTPSNHSENYKQIITIRFARLTVAYRWIAALH